MDFLRQKKRNKENHKLIDISET